MSKVIAAIMLALTSPAFAEECDRYITEPINCEVDQQHWQLRDKAGNVIQNDMNHRDCQKAAEGRTPALGLEGAPFACVQG